MFVDVVIGELCFEWCDQFVILVGMYDVEMSGIDEQWHFVELV